eukprot:6488736-Karenia_brevis.AAC.1
MTLRRMGHILEGSTLNVASQLRQTPQGSFWVNNGSQLPLYPQQSIFMQTDPMSLHDPWATPDRSSL